MAFTFDAKAASSIVTSSGLTQAHTCNASAKLLVVCLGVRGNTTTAVSYGGQALTLAISANEPTDIEKTEIWYKVTPLTGANNVVVALGASLEHAVSISSWLAGSTPSLDVTATDSGTGATGNPNGAVTGAVGGLAIDCVTAEEAPGTPGAYWIPGGDQTELHEIGSASWSVFSSYELSPASNESFDWTANGGTNTDVFAQAIAVFKEGGGGTDYTGTVPAAGAATATGRTPLVSTMTRPFASTTIA